MIDATPWANRPHPGPRAPTVTLTDEDRAYLEALLRTGRTEWRVARRAQGLLLMAEGVPEVDVARLVGVAERTVRKWYDRFGGAAPLARLTDAPRSGRPVSLFRRPTAPESSLRPANRRPTSGIRSRTGRTATSPST
jgi:hypothetical protein